MLSLSGEREWEMANNECRHLYGSYDVLIACSVAPVGL